MLEGLATLSGSLSARASSLGTLLSTSLLTPSPPPNLDAVWPQGPSSEQDKQTPKPAFPVSADAVAGRDAQNTKAVSPVSADPILERVASAIATASTEGDVAASEYYSALGLGGNEGQGKGKKPSKGPAGVAVGVDVQPVGITRPDQIPPTLAEMRGRLSTTFDGLREEVNAHVASASVVLQSQVRFNKCEES
jgi:hypothetical protein